MESPIKSLTTKLLPRPCLALGRQTWPYPCHAALLSIIMLASVIMPGLSLADTSASPDPQTQPATTETAAASTSPDPHSQPAITETAATSASPDPHSQPATTETATATESTDATTPLDPAGTVEAFHAGLIQVMKTPGLAERQALLTPIVALSFDFNAIGRISLGRSWRKMEEPARIEFADLLQRLVVATYTSRFGQYQGQTFNTIEVSNLRRGRKQVHTQLVTKEQTVNLDYQLDETDQGWRIYDVVANGVSDLSLKKSNYSALLKQGGMDAVITSINESIRKSQADYRP